MFSYFGLELSINTRKVLKSYLVQSLFLKCETVCGMEWLLNCYLWFAHTTKAWTLPSFSKQKQKTYALFFLVITVSNCRLLLSLSLLSIIGPNLHGLFGKQYGTAPGYSYSAASKNKVVIWEEKTLYDYLLNPKEVWRCFFHTCIIQIRY